MSKTVEKVLRFIERYSMLGGADGTGASGIVVAVSGGADSVALLDILARLQARDEGRRAEGMSEDQRLRPSRSTPVPSILPPLHVAHIDHKLRGRESAEDAEFVRRLAERRGLPVTVGEADARAEAERAGRGIEDAARELRYDFLLRVARENGCDLIATGHTMSDQAETFLMRLARGAGSRGLASMRPVGPAHDFAGLGLMEGGTGVAHESSSASADVSHRPRDSRPLLIRPLLCIKRDEVESYCRAQNLEFRTDATNLSGDYLRNRVRSDVLPALRAINPRVDESIARAAEIISTDDEALDHLASSRLDAARLKGGRGGQGRSGVTAYSAAGLAAQPVGLRRRMIMEAIRREREARSGLGPAGAQVTSRHIASVESLLGEHARGKRIALPGGLDAWREFNAIVFMPSARRGDSGGGACGYEISGSHPSVEAGGFQLTLERALPARLLGQVIDSAREGKLRLGRDWMIVALDECALPDRLIVRTRRAGERARTLSQRKTKKLKNLMIDHKIPTSRRNTWPVVVTPDDRYIWSPGLPPSFEFAARDKSTRLAILRASDT